MGSAGSTIIVREEKDGYLLYNSKNCDLVSVSHETFKSYFTHNGYSPKEVYERILNDFLTKKKQNKKR